MNNFGGGGGFGGGGFGGGGGGFGGGGNRGGFGGGGRGGHTLVRYIPSFVSVLLYLYVPLYLKKVRYK